MKIAAVVLFSVSLVFAKDVEAQVLKSGFIFEEAPFKECHASTITSTTGGEIIASWFAGTKEANNDVEIWVSRTVNGKWTKPISVANGIQHQSKRYPCWNPVLFQVPNGPLMLFYKVGPNPSKWWGMLMESSDGGVSWSDSRRLPEDVMGPIKNKPILLSDGKLICPTSTEETWESGWKMHFEITTDLGKTWAVSAPIKDDSLYNAIQPSILLHGGDTLQAVARSMDGGVVSSWSYNGGDSWTSLKSTGLPNPNSGTDAVTLKNGMHLIVYNHVGKEKGKWGGPRYPLNVAISPDGHKWKKVLTLEEERGEYSYPAVIQSGDGLVHILYTWKRSKIKHLVVDPGLLMQGR